MLEFAVTAPLALVLVLGLFQVGMVAYASQMAKEASRHGARTGSVAMDRPADLAPLFPDFGLALAHTVVREGEAQVRMRAWVP